MDDNVINRLTLVTVFGRDGINRYVSAYADVTARSGLSYATPMATIQDIDTGDVTTITIKPFALADADEVASLA